MVYGFPGMGGDSQPLPSGDPSLPSNLNSAYAAQQVGQQVTSAQRDALLSGDMEQKLERFVESTLTSLATVALNTIAKTQGGQDQLSALAGMMGVPGYGGGNRAPSQPTGPQPQPAPETAPVGPPEGRRAPSAPEHVPTASERYKEGYSAVQGMTMGSIARSAAGVGARYLSEQNPNWQEVTLDDGRMAWQRQDSATGSTTTVAQDDPGYEHLGRSIRRTGYLANAATRFAGGEGSVGAIGGVVGKFAGPIGMGVSAAMAIGNTLEKQNEQAATYRGYFGGEGTGGFAAQDRMGEWIAGLQGFGTIGGDRARAQFQQASSLGLRGDRREQATDFAGSMYMKYGMDTSESMKIVEQAINSGNVSLTQFGEAIAEVSKAAVEAGKSSKEAIQEFVDAQDYVSKNITSGGGSIQLTKGLAGVSEQLGRPLSKALGGTKGLASLLTQQNTQMIASMSGQDPSAALFRSMDPKTAAAQGMATLEGLGNQVVSMIAANLGMSEPALRAEVMRITAGKPVSSERQFSIFARLAGGEQGGGMAIQVLQAVTDFFGYGVTPAQVLNLFFAACTGKFKPEEEKAGSESTRPAGQHKKVSTSTAYKANSTGSGTFASPTHTDEYNAQRQSLLESLGYAGSQRLYDGSVTSDNPDDLAAFNAYTDYVARTGKSSPLMEGLLSRSNAGALGEAGGTNDLEDVRYRVYNKGKAGTASLAQIAANPSYMRQLERGRVEVLGADKNSNPTAVTSIVQLELMGEAAKVLRHRNGPTDAQRAGVPEGGTASGGYPIYGGN